MTRAAPPTTKPSRWSGGRHSRRPWRSVVAACGLLAVGAATPLLVSEGSPLEPPPAYACDEPASQDLPAAALHLPIAKDTPVEVVLGTPDNPETLVYLHGFCGDPYAFGSWADAASKHGTLISVRGDLKCKKRPERRRWSYNMKRTRDRIDRAVAAVDVLRAQHQKEPVPLNRKTITLIGYSQGAKRVEWLTAHYPKHFPRVAIIAIADEPEASRLRQTQSVLLMAGARDARKHIFEGYQKLRRGKARVRYLELPGAKHGEYGPEANEVMGDGLGWLLTKVP